MRIVPARALALVSMTSLVLACASETPPPSNPPSGPVGTSPPPRPATPPTPDAAASPAPAPTPPPTAGTGGSGGAGGTGGTGGSTPMLPDAGAIADAPPAIPLCDPALTIKATGDDGLIDDFNDNDAVIRMADGRMGAWTNGQSPNVELASMVNPELVTVTGMNRALRYRGTVPPPPAEAYAQLDVTFVDVDSGCYDASAYGGIQLAVRGIANTRVRVWVYTGDVRALGVPNKYGNWYRFDHTITGAMNTFTTISIPWEQFLPGDLAPEPRRLDPALVWGLVVSPTSRPGDAGVNDQPIGMFDFTIDNVRFLPKTTVPPSGDGGTRQ
jgi:hypothetical protein